MQHGPAKQEEQDHTPPEHPLVLLRPSLYHPDRVPADPQCVRNAVQPTLRPLEYLALLAQIRKHRTPAVEELVQLIVCVGEERLLAQRVGFAVIVCRGSAEAEARSGGRRVRKRGGRWWKRGLRVGVLRGRTVMGTASQKFVTVGDGLLRWLVWPETGRENVRHPPSLCEVDRIVACSLQVLTGRS